MRKAWLENMLIGMINEKRGKGWPQWNNTKSWAVLMNIIKERVMWRLPRLIIMTSIIIIIYNSLALGKYYFNLLATAATKIGAAYLGAWLVLLWNPKPQWARILRWSICF